MASQNVFKQPLPLGQLGEETGPQWLWRGYLARGGVTFLSGPRKGAKTMMAAHLLKSSATGGSLCGRALLPCKVLLITSDQPDFWAVLRDDLDIEAAAHVIAEPFTRRPSVADWYEFMRGVEEWIEANGCDLVIFDAINDLWCAHETDDAAEIARAMKPLHRLPRTCGVLLIHNQRKNTDLMLGIGAGESASSVDILLELLPVENRPDLRILKAVGRYEETPASVNLQTGNFRLEGETK